MTMDPNTRRFAAAMVRRAFLDAENGDTDATAWLASTRAIPYFELLEVDQEAMLSRSDWREWADEALEGLEPQDDNFGVLKTTLDYLEMPHG